MYFSTLENHRRCCIFDQCLKTNVWITQNIEGCTVAWWLALQSCSYKIPGLRPGLGLGSFCMEFTCSACACVGFLLVVWLPPPVQKYAEVNSKLSIGVNASVIVSLCSPAVDR